jgi:CHAD domain-containing protein
MRAQGSWRSCISHGARLDEGIQAGGYLTITTATPQPSLPPPSAASRNSRTLPITAPRIRFLLFIAAHKEDHRVVKGKDGRRTADRSPSKSLKDSAPEGSRGGNPTGDLSAPVAALDTASRWEEAFRDGWRKYRLKLRKCRREFAPATVHDLRIALRRLIATVEAASRLMACPGLKKLRRGLKKKLGWMGRLRDAQVQGQLLEQFQKQWPPTAAFAKRLLEKEARLSRRVRQKLKARAGEGAIQAAGKKVRRFLEKAGRPGGALDTRAAEAVRQSFQTVLERAREVAAEQPETCHRLRVALKKLRYQVETFQAVLPGVGEDALRWMRDLQVRLGEIQDLHVLAGDWEKFVRRHREVSREAGRAVGRELAARLRGSMEEIRSFLAGLQELARRQAARE